MKKAELLQGIDLEAPVEYHTYVNGQPFVIEGQTDAVIDQAVKDQRRVHTVALVARVATNNVSETTEPERPVYKEPSLGKKVLEYASDTQWRLFDHRYGTDIAGERKAQRVAQRILVARMAAGVDEMPVWGKYKKALAVASKLI